MTKIRRLGPLTLTSIAALAGAALTLLAGLVFLGAEDASHLIAPLAIASILTVGVIAFATKRMDSASLGTRFASVAGLASLIGLVNLVVVASLMFVSEKDALLIGALLIYAAAVSVAAGVAMSRASSDAIERLAATSRRIADGDLAARAEAGGGGRELDSLARTLDTMAARLEESLRRERAAEDRRRDLIVAVSHDLRTPVAGLRAMAEAIRDGVVEDRETIEAYSSQMGLLVESLGRLIDDLFEFVQLDVGAIEAETERALVADVIDNAMAACGAEATAKGLILSADLGEAGSASCSPRLSRVIQNLVQNAIRHTPADGAIRVAAKRDSGQLELLVEDTGEGIPADSVDRIFEPFWRGDSARGSDGSGLGLALAKRIVEALDGQIEVTSAPQNGSRFAVSIPHLETQPGS